MMISTSLQTELTAVAQLVEGQFLKDGTDEKQRKESELPNGT
jgi:hypothetical protein